MNMSTRIRRAWAILAAALENVGGDETSFLLAVQNGLRTSVPEVSRHVREQISSAPGIALVLNGAPGDLPLSTAAVNALLLATRDNYVADPLEFLSQVDAIAWKLAVFRDETDACPCGAGGDLEVWSTYPPERNPLLVCDFLSCTFSVDRVRCPRPAALLPGSRALVLRVYPGADLAWCE